MSNQVLPHHQTPLCSTPHCVGVTNLQAEQLHGICTNAQGPVYNEGGLLTPSKKATGAQHSGTQEAQPTSGGISTAPSLLEKTVSGIRNVVVEAALISTCPDGVLCIPPQTSSSTEAGRATCETSKQQLKSDPAVQMFLSRFSLVPIQSSNLQPPEKLLHLCKCLGMHPCAANGWSAMSLNPRGALGIFFLSSSLLTIICAILYGVGLRHSSWQPCFKIFTVVFTAADTAIFCLFWRYGPLFSKKKVYYIPFALWLTLVGICGCLSYVGPMETVPFHSPLANMLLLGPAVLLANVANKLGRLPLEHPSAPMPGFRVVFFDATIRTLRLMDSFTDMILVRLLATEVKHHHAVLHCNKSCIMWQNTSAWQQHPYEFTNLATSAALSSDFL
jgi:hypothetical protein